MNNLLNQASTFKSLQQLNEAIFGRQNNLHFEKLDFAAKISRYGTRAMKAFRQGKKDSIAHEVTMTFSWAIALANRMGFDLGHEVWTRFPGHCPYCSHAPCECSIRSSERTVTPPSIDRVRTVDGLQSMFARIYPNNTLIDAVMHLAEEGAEVSEAIQMFNADQSVEMLEKVREELVDVIANSFAVASCAGFRIIDVMMESFQHGCARCRKEACMCGVTVADSRYPHSVVVEKT